MINWNRQADDGPNSTSDYIRKMETGVDNLCNLLSKDTKDFNARAFFEVLHAYIKNEDRLLYTNITNYIFSLEKEEVFGMMQTNLDKVIKYIYSEQFDIDYPWVPNQRNSRNPFLKTKRTVLKMWDHMNLAKRQYVFLKLTDDDYSRVVDEKMKDAEGRMTKEMNMQLISLVSIFTALSFLIFGGISSLDNIFIGVKDIPIIKLMIVGTIWCFCIMNLIYVFMFFIAKLTGLNIKSTQDVNANLIQKYPLIWWCNLVIVSILIISCWAYYIKSEGFCVSTYEILIKYSTAYIFLGTIGIIILIVFAAIKIYKLSK